MSKLTCSTSLRILHIVLNQHCEILGNSLCCFDSAQQVGAEQNVVCAHALTHRRYCKPQNYYGLHGSGNVCKTMHTNNSH